uniref:Intraflagellar transport protein 22 homolog n=1 Tax=Clastoptera arizonana TaxID=38151 RepID=A0A1B6CYT5_9HEMI
MKVKILLVGPCKSGKSTIANFLSDSTDNVSGEYRPTQGVRIVEFEIHLNVNNRNIKADIELWDCSGDKKFETTWPVMYRDAQGIVFVCDAPSLDDVPQLNNFYECFVNQSGINYKNCLVLQHSKQPENNFPSEPLSNLYSKVQHIVTNVESGGNKLRTEFNNFVVNLISSVQNRTEQEELNIITLTPT